MKKTVRMTGLLLLCILLFGVIVSAAEPTPPVWERYAPAGGQVDDTAYQDVIAWLLIPGNRDAAMPNAAEKEVLASTIVENARSLVGKYPYVYGGESPEEGGFDCTGLVWYVYNQMSGLDITLSQAGRSKAALAAAGEKIYDRDAFLPGDVIQFTYAHVAIYVGGGRVVHARTTGTLIQETDLNYDNVEYAVRYPGVVQSAVLASGTWDGGLSWTLRRNGALTVSGSGAMSDPVSETAVPWYSYRETITSAELDEAITSIGNYAFFGCKNMKSISAPGVEKIGLASFYNCAALTAPVFSDGLLSIGRLGFYGCAALTGITLSDGMNAIDYGVFFGCSSLTGVTIPDTVTSIGDMAFEKCVSLESITLPDGVTHIGESAFFGCKALETITLGSRVEIIDNCAFYGCSSITAVSIPKTVTRIGDWAFADCSALAKVVYTGTVTEWNRLEIGEENAPLLNAKLTCTGMPDTPDITIVINADGIPVLLWEVVSNADKYEIWRADEDGMFYLLDETEETLYYDLSTEPGSAYFYMVRAVSGEKAGKFSDIAVYLQMNRAMGAPRP